MTTPTQPLDIGKLKELLQRATPGPWAAIESSSMKYCSAVEYRSDIPGLSQTVCKVREDGPLVGASRLSEQNANARLIAEAVNALPSLILMAERVERLEALIEQGIQALNVMSATMFVNGLDAGAEAADALRAKFRNALSPKESE